MLADFTGNKAAITSRIVVGAKHGEPIGLNRRERMSQFLMRSYGVAVLVNDFAAGELRAGAGPAPRNEDARA